MKIQKLYIIDQLNNNTYIISSQAMAVNAIAYFFEKNIDLDFIYQIKNKNNFMTTKMS